MGRKIAVSLAAAALLAALLYPSFSGMVSESAGEWNSCDNCNIVLISIDTLRADHLSSYGYFRETSPNIDGIAAGGVVFENAFSNIPFTPPSHWSIMTSLYPIHHRKYLPTDSGNGIATLAGILKENGYSTAGFVSSFMLKNLSDGFDVYDIPEGVPAVRWARRNTDINESERVKLISRARYRRAAETTDRALAWIENNAGRRFFLFVHLFDPHTPYNPPPEFDRFSDGGGAYESEIYNQPGVNKSRTIREEIGKYDGEILYADSNIGRIVNKISSLGLKGKTVFVITSDHGESFGEHRFSDFGYNSARTYLLHGKTLFDEETRVPLVISNPASSVRGMRIRDIAESVDIMPTILDIVGISYNNTDGESLVPLIKGAGKGRKEAFMQLFSRKDPYLAFGVRDSEGWKLVRLCKTEEGEEVCVPKEMLFYSGNHEKGDEMESHREVADRLESVMKTRISSAADEDIKKSLEMLGYV